MATIKPINTKRLSLNKYQDIGLHKDPSLIAKIVSLGLPLSYLGIFFAIPIIVFGVYSFWYLSGYTIVQEFTLSNYYEVFNNRVYSILILRSVQVAIITAIITVIMSYPVAYAMNFNMKEGREAVLMLLILSLFSSYLVRIYAWKTILGQNGLINNLLMSIGLIQEPLTWLLYSKFAVIVTLVSVFIPITILPIYSVLSNIHPSLLEASRNLGANSLQTFIKVTLPLSMPGLIAGFIFSFVLTVGEYVTPAIIGGADGQMIANAIANQYGTLSNWPLGSAITFSVIAILGLLLGSLGSLFKKAGIWS